MSEMESSAVRRAQELRNLLAQNKPKSAVSNGPAFASPSFADASTIYPGIAYCIVKSCPVAHSFAELKNATGKIELGTPCTLVVLPHFRQLPSVQLNPAIERIRNILSDEATELDASRQSVWRLQLDPLTVLNTISKLGFHASHFDAGSVDGVHTWIMECRGHRDNSSFAEVKRDMYAVHDDGSSENVDVGKNSTVARSRSRSSVTSAGDVSDDSIGNHDSDIGRRKRAGKKSDPKKGKASRKRQRYDENTADSDAGVNNGSECCSPDVALSPFDSHHIFADDHPPRRNQKSPATEIENSLAEQQTSSGSAADADTSWIEKWEASVADAERREQLLNLVSNASKKRSTATKLSVNASREKQPPAAVENDRFESDAASSNSIPLGRPLTYDERKKSKKAEAAIITVPKEQAYVLFRTDGTMPTKQFLTDIVAEHSIPEVTRKKYTIEAFEERSRQKLQGRKLLCVCPVVEGEQRCRSTATCAGRRFCHYAVDEFFEKIKSDGNGKFSTTRFIRGLFNMLFSYNEICGMTLDLISEIYVTFPATHLEDLQHVVSEYWNTFIRDADQQHLTMAFVQAQRPSNRNIRKCVGKILAEYRGRYRRMELGGE